VIYTTLNKIRDKRPCQSGWETLLKHLGKSAADDEPLGLDIIVESNGIGDALWSLRTVPEHHKTWRLLAVKFAREVQHLMKDERSIKALDVCEAHAKGEATDEQLKEAKTTAYAAAADAYADADADAAAAAAADAAAAAAADAADADDAAASAAAASAAAAAASAAAARKAMREKQKEIFIAMLNQAQ